MTDSLIRGLVDISQSPAALTAQADLMLERAKWAAEEFQRYDRHRTYAIAEAVARAGARESSDVRGVGGTGNRFRSCGAQKAQERAHEPTVS